MPVANGSQVALLFNKLTFADKFCQLNHTQQKKTDCYFDNTGIVTRIAPQFCMRFSIEEAHQN